MPLPILKTGATSSDLVRLFHKCDREYMLGICESTDLDSGTALYAAALPRVYDANRVVDAALAEGATPADAVAEADTLYGGLGLTCFKWVMNPAAPAERIRPLADHLLKLGFRDEASEIMYLRSHVPAEVMERPDVTVLPARASFKHWQQIGEEAASQHGEPQLVEVAMNHLDDSHYDALVAIRDGRAVGRIGVLTVGELGLIEQVHVAEHVRRQGIATLLMSRAIDICSRALLRHVLLRVTCDNEPAKALYGKFGFVNIGQYVEYVRPTSG